MGVVLLMAFLRILIAKLPFRKGQMSRSVDNGWAAEFGSHSPFSAEKDTWKTFYQGPDGVAHYLRYLSW